MGRPPQRKRGTIGTHRQARHGATLSGRTVLDGDETASSGIDKRASAVQRDLEDSSFADYSGP